MQLLQVSSLEPVLQYPIIVARFCGLGIQVNQPPLVGYDAKLMHSSVELINETKRIIGRKYSDVREEVERMAYNITEGAEQMAEIHIQSINMNVSPETVCYCIELL